MRIAVHVAQPDGFVISNAAMSDNQGRGPGSLPIIHLLAQGGSLAFETPRRDCYALGNRRRENLSEGRMDSA